MAASCVLRVRFAAGPHAPAPAAMIAGRQPVRPHAVRQHADWPIKMSGRSIIIIGAGIAGLAAGCYAQMNGYDSEIYEAHDKPGACALRGSARAIR